MKNQPIKGCSLSGKDIIEIVRDLDYKIVIINSIVRDGLDFSRLPAKKLDQFIMPSEWDHKKRARW